MSKGKNLKQFVNTLENHLTVTGWRSCFPIQVFLIFGGRCNRSFGYIRPEIYKLHNFNMLFQLLLKL